MYPGLVNIITFGLHQPNKNDSRTHRIPFKEGQLLDYTVQRHAAKHAGLHRDIRIGNKHHGLLSWATRSNLPASGKRIPIHAQPVHRHSYLGWSGTIKSGYGAGDVKTEHLGKALVTKVTKNSLHATLASQRGNQRLAFVRGDRGWILSRGRSPSLPDNIQKPQTKSLPVSKARKLLQSLPAGAIVQPKIDGALTYISVGRNPELYSHRKSKITGGPIIHTEKFFKGRPTLNIPKKHQGKTLAGELYGTRNGKVIEPQILGGILNANLGESLRRQKRDRINLKVMPFDILGEKAPYPERLQHLREIIKHFPGDRFHTPESVVTGHEANRLFKQIRSKRHPLTSEGLIIRGNNGPITKVKNLKEENVKIHSLFPGNARLKESWGGFIYSDHKNRPLGRVGTGFTDQTRRDLPRYLGRIARVRHQGRFHSGKLRAPSFIGIDESK